VKTPVVLALVELEEGPRLLTNLVDVAPDPAAIRCDMPVEVVFEKQTEDITLPMFRPLAAGPHLAQATHGSSRTPSGRYK
jgi:hypothetical protein